MNALPRRPRWPYCLAAAVALLVPACANWDGHIDLFGYTSRPLYDTSIRTVYVPIFQNVTFVKGIEFQLTRAVIREIEAKIPVWKVVSDRSCADTELQGKIVNWTKIVTIPNNLGEVRDMQTTMTVELIWRDLRPGHGGEILSQQPPGRPADPAPPLPPVPAKPPPVVVQSITFATPELGPSVATARQTNVDRLAVQIVSMMEKPW
jgi:hypothetical protein